MLINLCSGTRDMHGRRFQALASLINRSVTNQNEKITPLATCARLGRRVCRGICGIPCRSATAYETWKTTQKLRRQRKSPLVRLSHLKARTVFWTGAKGSVKCYPYRQVFFFLTHIAIPTCRNALSKILIHTPLPILMARHSLSK
jgi:hypothetical protein